MTTNKSLAFASVYWVIAMMYFMDSLQVILQRFGVYTVVNFTSAVSRKELLGVG